MPHRILQPCEGAVVKEGRLQRDVADWRGPKLVPVIRVTGDLLQTKILVLTRAVERHIPGDGSNLRDSDNVLREVAEHLVGRTRNLMAVNTPRFAKEEQRSSLLLFSQGARLPSRKLVYGCVGKNQAELKFGDRKPEHIKSDGAAGLHRGEDLTESLPVLGDVVDPSQYLFANIEIVAGETEPRDLNSLRRRNEGLGIKQMRKVRE